MQCLCDTDVLSEFIKGQNVAVAMRVAAYRSQYGQLQFSAVTRYEIVRGFLAKNAPRRLAQFQVLCQNSDIVALTDPIFDRAAGIWADLKRAGQLIEDNDIFIAATALHYGLVLATGNVAHFGRIPGLTLDDWARP